MQHSFSTMLAPVGLAVVLGTASAQTTTVGFETWSQVLPPTEAMGLYYLNDNSPVHEGITWDMRLRVVGADYRIQFAEPVSPLYGLVHGGTYYITNEGAGASNDGLLITTDRVLLGGWFGRNAYYGYSEQGGADQITIHALGGQVVLASVVFELPAPQQPGTPGAMAYVDTSSFQGLVGITGYRIDRRELGEMQGNWVADDLVFASAVPEPGAVAMLLAGLGVVAAARGRRGVSAAA